MDIADHTEHARPAPWRRVSRTLALVRSHVGLLSLKLIGALWPPNALVLARHAAALARRRPPSAPGAALEVSADSALGWLAHSQDRVGSGGVGCYEFYRWTAGYPEVTGYIIPTLWDYSRALGRDDLAQRAVRMADWELGIQRPDGGFEGGYEGDGQPQVVFNTAQVIRGLLRTAAETGEGRYLEAATRAGEWIVANQDEDGSWTRANFKGMKRVYDSYVSAPLARLAAVTGERSFAEAAARNCEFVLTCQRRNGWFELCDNNPRFNDAPLTHTICYTVDGLLEAGEVLGEPRFVEAATRAADAMLAIAKRSPDVPARLGAEWDTRARYVCVTGVAQLGVILMRLHERSGDARYMGVASELVSFLAGVQAMSDAGRDRRGALPGSYPLWGFYAPLKLPSWATKYHLDLLLLMRAAERGAAGPAAAAAGAT
jgi:rhamnogalacturonyl hydrolase YesR